MTFSLAPAGSRHGFGFWAVGGAFLSVLPFSAAPSLDGGPLPAGQPAVLVTGSAGTAGGARQLPAPGMPA